jgi:hypothetical protein
MIHNRNLKYTTINIDKYNIHKNTEAYAIPFDSTYNKLRTLIIYKTPMGNFKNFINQSDLNLQKLYNIKFIIICDANVNYLINNRKIQLDAILHSYNLTGIVKFPTITDLNSHTAINNAFIGTSTIGKYDLYPLINGHSDHDTPLLTIKRYRNR